MISIINTIILTLMTSHVLSALVEVDLLFPEKTSEMYQLAFHHEIYRDGNIIYLEHADSGVIREITKVEKCTSLEWSEEYGLKRDFGSTNFVECRFVYGDRVYVQRNEFFSFLRRYFDFLIKQKVLVKSRDKTMSKQSRDKYFDFLDRYIEEGIGKDYLGDYETVTITKDKEDLRVIDWSTVDEETGKLLRFAMGWPGCDFFSEKNEQNYAVIEDFSNVSALLDGTGGAYKYLRVSDLVNFQRKILRMKSNDVRVEGTIFG
jgi:hypothetical protein